MSDFETKAELIIIPSDTGEAKKVQDIFELGLQNLKAPDKDVFCIRLALEEALVNAIKHGNQMDISKKVFIKYTIDADQLEIIITDEGLGFDPNDVPDPTDIENLERPCGRGLMLMRHYMTEVKYNAVGNSVHMKKVFKKV